MFFKNNIKSAMETEIFEQPNVAKELLKKYKSLEFDFSNNVKKIVIVASGSSYHCARFSVELIEQLAGIEAQAIYSSDFILKNAIPHDKNTLYVFITQSGETTDTVTALKKVNEGFIDENGGKYWLDTVSITNVVNSTIWNETKYHFDCSAGKENSIAATKSFTAQMICFLFAALKIAKNNGINIDDYMNAVEKLPEVFEKALALRPQVKKVSKAFTDKKCVVVTADRISFPISLEAALKIKETSYLNVNAVPLGEFLHGHVAVLNNKKPALVYISVDTKSKTAVSNFEKIRADYKPTVFIIGKHHNEIASDYSLAVDYDNSILQIFGNVVLIQLLALENASNLHRNIDNPKGLKKVVK